jgi:hypothetical protein
MCNASFFLSVLPSFAMNLSLQACSVTTNLYLCFSFLLCLFVSFFLYEFVTSSLFRDEKSITLFYFLLSFFRHEFVTSSLFRDGKSITLFFLSSILSFFLYEFVASSLFRDYKSVFFLSFILSFSFFLSV